MMGSGRQGVSICFTTLRACARMFETLNEIALSSGTRSRRPHAMQNDSELVRDRDPGSRHTPVLRDLHAPGAQARPFAAAYEPCVRRFVERCADKLVTASAAFALDSRLAGLVAPSS